MLRAFCIVMKFNGIFCFRIVAEMPWMCLMPDDVLDSANKELVKQDMTMPNGEEYEFKDRRQEIVFIGKDIHRG